MLDLDEIEARAEAATPGPWKAQDEGRHRGVINIEENGRFIETIATAYCGAVDGHGAANARYIAALSPDVALALVARVRELEAEVARLAPRGEPVRGVDVDCEHCGARDGSTLDNGWYRCNRCGYPGK